MKDYILSKINHKLKMDKSNSYPQVLQNASQIVDKDRQNR